MIYRHIKIRDMNDDDLINMSKRHGLSLSLDEMKAVRDYFIKEGRDPIDAEIHAIAQSWSEHCSYKSSKFYLKKYLTNLKTDYTILAMEDDAGVVEFDKDYAYVLKMESHNHPSAVEPYGGAATGIGGIVRDVVCMGAQPIALVDSLFMGDVASQKYDALLSPRYIFQGVVGGIRDYGNRIGVPNVAGSVYFDQSYNSNPLVNAGCIGIVRKDRIVRSKSYKAGDKLLLVGGKTGRDGIHGVNFASATLTRISKSSRNAIQLGNPIVEHPMMRAVLEANELGIIKAMKDLGGGGLSSAATEMVFAGGFGAEISLDDIKLKDTDMSGWEIWISESQERMLVEVLPEDVEKMKEIAEKWSLDFSILGTVVEGKKITVRYKNKKIIDMDIEFLDKAPVYQRPFERKNIEKKVSIPSEPEDLNDFALNFVSRLNNSARFNVVRQYDHTVRGSTIVGPFSGRPNLETHSDATVIKPLEDSMRGLLITSGSRPNFVSIDPYNGTLETLSEAVRNIVSTGGKPNSVVDALNFGNPERQDIMGQFVESVRAIGDFCRKFSLPVVAGNVSFYNEFRNKDIMPTPTIMMVGIIDDVTKARTTYFKKNKSQIYLVGTPCDNLSGSEYARMNNIFDGFLPAPNLSELQLEIEKIGKFSPYILSAHDVSDGGLFMALAEMSFGSGIGFNIDLGNVSASRSSVKLFSECGNQIVLEIDPIHEEEFTAEFKDLKIVRIGETGGDRIIIDEYGMNLVDLPVQDLRERWEHGLDAYI
ncbi:phosphoribosylformylglycinamide synthase large subunit [Thermoplasma volcanium GSS1]|uniref:Phosphoribosylformylglycinamidine synthase subunit PurL n=1 Tax=Thermoplasma volcanium (strain ATCC 51530 / DSM 4299 / JCM 9571 / NBRC 15438 / GSS1) TaxID=273116 RepID=PURL_THEVO|nr:phosphoribosylformylglycinamidine synthase subunit PurL [Thermoplasma volcanium]Q97BD5.1 RecName: Full=Phosphoribosylformylglycinamidine synthase subunit PurL; Short=FGAM synthase; AltName: Full=Formylglycinamide ribonucleotide amidotransferase subunit II; Short=FGAR amidotransferase II; Short=FGAR-AT II; AltName: Full=Glutamine amidotransferase PurL; AltName: Full=Phosphoribosylformylglycinamidine synthase subunit II [Thermoplasma volcanium GSS1]BAB59663.1 phosphoribosylformylglycinamide synt